MTYFPDLELAQRSRLATAALLTLVLTFVFLTFGVLTGCQDVGWPGPEAIELRQGHLSVGPGLGNLTYTSSELFKMVSPIVDNAGARGGHGNVAMVNGYLATIYTTDGGGANAASPSGTCRTHAAPPRPSPTICRPIPSCAKRTVGG